MTYTTPSHQGAIETLFFLFNLFLTHMHKHTHTLTMEGINGARIPPTLLDIEHTPKPAFLKHTR